jgi:predicted neuraminidase
MPRVQPLTLPDGKLLLPLYSDGFSLSLVAISEDNGNTWKPGLPIVGRGNIQPALVRKTDGTIMAFMRDNGDFPGRVMLSESPDEGYTWSSARKSEIPNPGSSVFTISLKDGRWIMVYNDLEEGRYRLAVSLSDDEGKTWKWTRYLENRKIGEGSFSYPSVIQDSKGIIHVSYSWSVKQMETIMHAAFGEEWVKER